MYTTSCLKFFQSPRPKPPTMKPIINKRHWLKLENNPTLAYWTKTPRLYEERQTRSHKHEHCPCYPANQTAGSVNTIPNVQPATREPKSPQWQTNKNLIVKANYESFLESVNIFCTSFNPTTLNNRRNCRAPGKQIRIIWKKNWSPSRGLSQFIVVGVSAHSSPGSMVCKGFNLFANLFDFLLHDTGEQALSFLLYIRTNNYGNGFLSPPWRISVC